MQFRTPAGMLVCVVLCILVAIWIRATGDEKFAFQPVKHSISTVAITNGSYIPSETVSMIPALREEPAPPPDTRTLKNVNERFTYEVRYGFFRLGNIYVYLKGDTLYRDTPAIHMVTEMVSNRRLPLIGYREVHYHNLMAYNDTIPYGLRFWQNTLHHDMMERYVFDFDYDAGIVYSYEEGEAVDTLDLDRPADGGPAVMYYSRLFAGTDSHRYYPIYIDHERSDIEMTFSSERESFDSPAFPDEDVKVYTMEGNADFDGPFGFSGEFTAYYKDDELRIPLEARVGIWLGSVRVRLVEYERLN